MFKELGVGYKDAFVGEFGKSLEVSAHCFQNRWVGLSEFLETFDRGLDPILTPIQIACRPSVQYVPYASSMVESVVSGMVSGLWGGRSLEDLLQELGEVADYAENRVRNGLPLVSVETDIVLSGPAEGSWNSGVKLTDRQLVGAGILMACAAESPDSRSLSPDGWGPLGQMESWLGRRGSKAAKDTVPWAVEEGAFALLYRWVRGEINFFSPGV
jgi:hypothetical protein